MESAVPAERFLQYGTALVFRALFTNRRYLSLPDQVLRIKI